MKKKQKHTVKWLAVLWAVIGVGAFLVIYASIFINFDFRSKAGTGERTVFSRWEFNDQNLEGWSKVSGSFVYYEGGLMFMQTNNLNGPPASAIKYDSPIVLPEGTKEILFRVAVNPLEVSGGPESDSPNYSDMQNKKCFLMPKFCSDSATRIRARFCRLMEEAFPVCKVRKPVTVNASRALEMRVSYNADKLLDKPVMVTANNEFKEYRVEIPGVLATTLTEFTLHLPVADTYRQLKLDYIRIQGNKVIKDKECTPMPEECRFNKCKYFKDPEGTWCPEPTADKECGPCPAYAEPAGNWCPNGVVKYGEKDICGCYPPPICANCTPRPACLDANPPCDIPEPENMCPPKVVEVTRPPTASKLSCNTASDCTATCGLGCVNERWLSRENPNDCAAIPEYSCTCSADRKCIKVEPTRPPVSANRCVAAGCSGQLCVDSSNADIATDCEWREEYACYRSAECIRKDSGVCGWRMTDALERCIRDARSSAQ